MISFKRNDGGRGAAGFKGATGDCVARAVAIAADLPYTLVYDRLAEGNAAQRKTKRMKDNLKGVRTASHGIYIKRKWFRDYMAELGFVWVPVMGIGTGCKLHLEDGKLPKGRLVVRLSRHLSAVIDGVIQDTYDPQRSDSWTFEPDHGQALKANQGRNHNGVWTKVGGRAIYGYWRKK